MNPLLHVAIIMDGNGRWGIKNKKFRNAGHREGLKVVENIIKQSIKKKISYLTLYAFSTENWNRPKNEISYLFKLLEEFLVNKINDLTQKGICFKSIGEKRFGYRINKLLKNAEASTSNNNKLYLNLALNYGSKKEILNSFKSIIKKKEKLNLSNIRKNLYTSNMPDPDILIRTGNTTRLSNFLLWQLAYSEIYFVKKLWPDFTTQDYSKIIKKFKITQRNYGKI
jgi:undecaprenyl diphosphate synthase